MSKEITHGDGVLRRTVLKASAVAAGALAVSAPATASGDETEATVAVESHPDLGDVLVGPNGMVLYMFESDEQGADESACQDDCAEAWPPLTIEGDLTAGEGVTAELTTFERADGSTQVAAAGWPLYYFAQDEEPGDATGQGVNDVWWVLEPNGTPVRETAEDDHDQEQAEMDLDELTRQLLSVRAVTRPYWADVARAREDGYDEDVSPYTPGMGFHFVNPGLVAEDENAAVELAEPAILVYVPTEGYDPEPGAEHDPERDDELVLAAVEFAHTGTEGAAMNLFADEDADEAPLHSEEDGWVFVDTANVTALHVWIPHWNPMGVFHPTNPAVE
ncbi:hypothetical protein OB955_04955 [Halobacteria archaeon AArc-m2/3/4]|uniref:Lipoprotein n=1 Tax=Natronoglomus mannanivorans TaxID=2979990 RepID=A0ABT2QB27_9EURY|nr:hypothetical protein [Halobacteria archaeon AArc-m2/3/4]